MKTTFSPIAVTAMSVSEVTKKLQAELVQTVTQSYPKAKAGSSESDSLFEDEDFGTGLEFVKTRKFWMTSPDGTTAEQVAAKLAAYPNARIRRTLASEPILSAEQEGAIAAGLTTFAKIAASQLVVFGKDHVDAGKPILVNGRSQYSRYDLQLSGNQDRDLRLSSTEIAEIA